MFCCIGDKKVEAVPELLIPIESCIELDID